MSNQIVYIDFQQAIELYNWICKHAGECQKYQDYYCLEDILEEIKHKDKYLEFKDRITHLIFAINNSQKSIADSKRFSIALGCYFLELNGYDYVVHYFMTEMENIVIWLADGKISKNLLTEIIESLIYEDDYSEELKLKIALAIS